MDTLRKERSSSDVTGYGLVELTFHKNIHTLRGVKIVVMFCVFVRSSKNLNDLFWPEATDTILSFTKNAEEFLRRKKVHRDLIFKYLVKEGVAMSPNSEKHQLVKRTLELWSSGKVSMIGTDQCRACLSVWQHFVSFRPTLLKDYHKSQMRVIRAQPQKQRKSKRLRRTSTYRLLGSSSASGSSGS